MLNQNAPNKNWQMNISNNVENFTAHFDSNDSSVELYNFNTHMPHLYLSVYKNMYKCIDFIFKHKFQESF